jgi:hypothetical protein
MRPAEELAARQQIVELVHRRGRAADAKDPDAIVACHLPGSRDAHGIFDGTIEEFGQYLRTHNYADPRYGLQRHTVSNVLVDCDCDSADAARVESYHLAYHRIVLGDVEHDVQIGGRYLDQVERVNGRWLIRSRTVVYDWSRSARATAGAARSAARPPGRRAQPRDHSKGDTMSDDADDRAALAELLAKQRITDVLYKRARAGDRRDVELALSCYHPGATEDHEGFAGTAADFITERSMISPHSTAPVSCLWHFISNIVIDVRGDEADVESYHIAVVIRRDADTETQSTIGGRYLDRFAFRDGRWAIVHRDVVFDLSRVDPPTTPYWDLVGLDEAKLLRGAFGPDDPLYSHLSVSRGSSECSISSSSAVARSERSRRTWPERPDCPLWSSTARRPSSTFRGQSTSMRTS